MIKYTFVNENEEIFKFNYVYSGDRLKAFPNEIFSQTIRYNDKAQILIKHDCYYWSIEGVGGIAFYYDDDQSIFYLRKLISFMKCDNFPSHKFAGDVWWYFHRRGIDLQPLICL